jgi:hypothetical protein
MDLVNEDNGGEYLDTVAGTLNDEDREEARNKRILRMLIQEVEGLSDQDDQKLINAVSLVKQFIEEGYNPIVFCRFIPTAEYVADKLRTALRGVEVDQVTGLLPPEERENRVAQLSMAAKRVLVCTDCLSEGINLQEFFDAVLHYDLAWNPTRHEQREGRVDRYGQSSSKIRVVTYFGIDNHIDGLVLNVLIRKHKTIRDSLGISVPVPAQAENVVDAIFEWMLLKKDWSKEKVEEPEQLTLFEEFIRPQQQELDLQWESAAQREKRSRTLFAQETIKVDEVAREMKEMKEAVGFGVDVETFVREALTLSGGIVSQQQDGLSLDLSQASSFIKDMVPTQTRFIAKFALPVKKGEIYCNRTHPFVEGLSNYIIESALEASGEGVAKRAGVVKTRQVSKRTTLLLVRFRYHIITIHKGKDIPLLAEECRLLAFEGSPENAIWLDDGKVEEIFRSTPDTNTPPEVAREFVARVINGYKTILPHLEGVAMERGEVLLEAHKRVRTASRQKGVRYRVEPNLPPDILGIYIFLPVI